MVQTSKNYQNNQATANSPKPDYNVVYLLRNRRATNWQRVDRLYQTVVKAFQPKQQVELDLFEDKIEPTKKLRQAIPNWNEQTLVCIGGGDGTISFVVHELLMSDSKTPAAQRAVLLPLWGGNANDLAMMLNGFMIFNPVKNIRAEAKPVDVHPLKVTIHRPKETKEVRLAVSYASFGASAHATWAMESSSHNRTSRWLTWPGVRLAAEVWDVCFALLKAPSFEVEHDDGRKQLYERIFTNGSRVAKLNALPVKLNQKSYYEASVDKRHIHFVWYGIKSFLRSHGTVRSEPTTFTIHHPTKAQVDGEVIDIASGSKITIAVHNKSVRMLSKRLA